MKIESKQGFVIKSINLKILNASCLKPMTANLPDVAVDELVGLGKAVYGLVEELVEGATPRLVVLTDT